MLEETHLYQFLFLLLYVVSWFVCFVNVFRFGAFIYFFELLKEIGFKQHIK